MNSDLDNKEYFQQLLFAQDSAKEESSLFDSVESTANDALDLLEKEEKNDLAEEKEILAFSQENPDTPLPREQGVMAAEPVAEMIDSDTEKLESPAPRKHVFPPLTRSNLLRAALGFLRKLKPSGMGVNFNSGTYTHVDAGAYFLSTQKKKALVSRTIAVLTVSDTKRFQLDIACRRELLETLSLLNNKRVKLEEIIQETEPELCDETLFRETCVWHYEESQNKDYQACMLQIAKVQYSLVKGNVFERFISNQIADELYVVTTENLISVEEVPPMWGLVYIDKNFRAKIIRKAEKCETNPEKRLLFALRAATSAPDDFLFAKGITLDKDNNVTYHPVPRNRKPYTPGDC